MTNFLMTTLAVAWKELQELLKDRGLLVVLFLMPLLMALFISSANAASSADEGESAEPAAIRLDVFVVNQDNGPYGDQVVSALNEMNMLDVTMLTSAEDADQQVADGKAQAAIIIPTDFSQQIDAYQPTQVQIITDPTQAAYASLVNGLAGYALTPVVLQGEVQHGIRTVLDESGLLENASPEVRRAIEAQNLGVIMTRLQALVSDPFIALRSENTAGEETEAPPFNFFTLFVPGFTVMFAFFNISAVAGTINSEKDAGTFRRLLAAPISRGAIIAGKMLTYMVIVSLQVLIMFGVGGGFFGMPLGHSLAGLVVITLALGFVVAALGMLLAALIRTRSQAESVGTILSLILAGLGGCIPIGVLTPLYRQEGLLASISRLTPHSYALDGYNRLMAEGAGLGDVLPLAAVIVGMGIVFFVLAVWRFRFE
jgi:ABC-2 type transport system permease protein